MNEKVEKLADIAKAFPNEKVAEQALAVAWATEQREPKKG